MSLRSILYTAAVAAGVYVAFQKFGGHLPGVGKS